MSHKKIQVNTGIEGLDPLLDGGFIKNRVILIQGKAGTGKSTFGLQYLVNGAKQYNEPGLLVSLEYEVNDLIVDMSDYNWSITELINNNLLKIIIPSNLEQLESIKVDDLINIIHQAVIEVKAKRIVIDSLNTLEVALSLGKNMRKELIRFITLLRDLDCTVLLLNEDYTNDTNEIYGYTSHGIIELHNIKIGSNRLRAIEIVKMRGINHSTLTHSISINPKVGIVVLPHEIDFSSV